MLRGTQLRPSEQRKRLQRYLRVLRANYNRAYRELSEVFLIRKGCPFEHRLRSRRFDDAIELVKLAEKCLAEINHCYALRLAAFRPGDQMIVRTVMRGYEPRATRYLVLDVEWGKRDEYHYVVHELTKAGELHKGRYASWVWPSNRISIELCDAPLGDDARRYAEGRRRAANELFDAVLQQGDISMFAPPPPKASPSPPSRPFPFWLRNSF